MPSDNSDKSVVEKKIVGCGLSFTAKDDALVVGPLDDSLEIAQGRVVCGGITSVAHQVAGDDGDGIVGRLKGLRQFAQGSHLAGRLRQGLDLGWPTCGPDRQ